MARSGLDDTLDLDKAVDGIYSEVEREFPDAIITDSSDRMTIIAVATTDEDTGESIRDRVLDLASDGARAGGMVVIDSKESSTRKYSATVVLHLEEYTEMDAFYDRADYEYERSMDR